MQFLDKVRIVIKAGSGGDGCSAFHREKFVMKGGPSGGDGGNGGNLVFRADPGKNTLLEFRYQRFYRAENGEKGKAKMQRGKDGEALVISVPVGTVVRDVQTGTILADMSEAYKERTVLKGGRGGKGNARYATPTHQAPTFAQNGVKTDEREVELELKTIADAGLIGLPSVGKSSILSVLTAAKPKIAAYHFTTLTPNLGVAEHKGRSFVLADIPGLIEGAAEGAGLGHDFLRHIERTRVLIHVLDAAGSEGRDPLEDFEKINAELKSYSEELAKRPMIVAANKCDLIPEGSDNLERLRSYVTEQGYEFYEISAATTQGTKQLMRVIAGKLRELPPVIVYESEYVKPLPEAGEADDLTIEHMDDLWVISGTWLRRLISDINFADYESRMYFDRQLRKSGLFDRLEQMGIEDGDTVSIYDFEFDYER